DFLLRSNGHANCHHSPDGRTRRRKKGSCDRCSHAGARGVARRETRDSSGCPSRSATHLLGDCRQACRKQAMNLGAGWLRGIYASLLASCLLYAVGVQAQVVTLQLATQTLAGTAQYDGASKFAELVAQKSNGKLAVKVFGDGALGGDLQVISSLQRGSVDMSL